MSQYAEHESARGPMSERFLILSANINANTTATLIPYLIGLQMDGAKRLTIAINSSGGSVVEGIAIHHAMLAMPFEIVMHNFSNVDSIANVVFLAGTERYASPSSTFMFHGVGFNGDATERLEEKNILEKLDVIRADHKRISKLIASRIALSEQACLRLFKQQRTRGATWAKSNGIVHEIRDFILPAGAEVHHLV